MAENNPKLAKTLKKEMHRSKLSEHLNRLAQPKRSSFMSDEPTQQIVKKSTLKYKATKRIQNLAQPKSVNPKKVDREPIDVLTQSISTVSPSALNYKATRRILELAQPK